MRLNNRYTEVAINERTGIKKLVGNSSCSGGEKMEDVVNVFLCRDGRDVEVSMLEYAEAQRSFTDDVKINRYKRTVVVNGGWVTKFVSEPAYLDGMYIREITISTRMSTGGDIDKLTNMLNQARQGRIAFQNSVINKIRV